MIAVSGRNLDRHVYKRDSPFVRLAAAALDTYLSKGAPRHSRAV